MLDLLKVLAALVNIAFGLFAFFQPVAVARGSGYTLQGALGHAEIRIAFGGYFIGMGLAALLMDDLAAYRAVGAGWLAAAVIRGITLFIEDRRELLSRNWFIIWASEIIVGGILLA